MICVDKYVNIYTRACMITQKPNDFVLNGEE